MYTEPYINITYIAKHAIIHPNKHTYNHIHIHIHTYIDPY